MYTDVKIEHMLIDYTSVFGRFLNIKKAPTNTYINYVGYKQNTSLLQ
jgi:hypothetical protein